MSVHAIYEPDPKWMRFLEAAGSCIWQVVKYGGIIAIGATVGWIGYFGGEQVGFDRGVQAGCSVGMPTATCAVVNKIGALRMQSGLNEPSDRAKANRDQAARLCGELRAIEHGGPELAELARCE